MSDQLLQTITGLSSDVKTWMGRTSARVDALQAQFDALDLQKQFPGFGGGSSDPAATIAKGIVEHKQAFESHGRVRFDVPSLIQHKTFVSTNLVNPETHPTIGTDGGFRYGNVRALFRVVTTNSGSIFQIRETDSSGWNASPQVESSAKNQSEATLTGETLSVQTLAHWVPVSKQALDDVEGLEAFLRGRLLWGLDLEVDEQIVAGNGSGQNLKGLTSVAQAFDTALLNAGAGWDLYFVAGAAGAQVRRNGYNPSFFLCHPNDAFRMGFTRDDEGRYLIPPQGVPPVVQSVAVAEGTFIAGDASQAMIRARQMATIDMSESHSDYFTKNLVAIRAEERLAFQTMSHKAFVYGSFVTSPA